MMSLKRGEKSKGAVLPPVEMPMEATVTNLYLSGWQNPKLVSVMVDGCAARMRVKDRAAFRPGMLVRCRWVSEGLYEVVT
jgi:hypothetical protein